MRPSLAVILVVSPFLASACLTSPFVRDDGPVKLEGATVSLDRQRCNYDPPWARPDDAGGELVLWIRMTVANDSDRTLTVLPRELRLQGPNVDLTAGPELPESEGNSTIPPSEKKTFAATFRQDGYLSCTSPMSLSLERFLQMGGAPVPLPKLSFVADAADD